MIASRVLLYLAMPLTAIIVLILLADKPASVYSELAVREAIPQISQIPPIKCCNM